MGRLSNKGIIGHCYIPLIHRLKIQHTWQMRIEQINTAHRKPLLVGNREIQTGIFKTVCPGSVRVAKEGLEGDAVCNMKHHGGPDQAVYLYSLEDYAFWGRQLGREVEPGTFGENLTVSDIDLRQVCVGDLLVCEAVTLQVTAPRIPCNTLAARMEDRQFAKKFVQANRSGAYCRVLKEGDLIAGDVLTWSLYDGDRISLATFFTDSHRRLSDETVRRYLAAPIDIRSRRDFEKDLNA